MPGEQAAPVAPAAPATAAPREPALRRALRHPRAPVFALAIGTVIVAAVVVRIAVEVTGWALDETVVKQSALHYRHGLPGTLFHDLNARATSRLFSLLLMPVFALWDGDTGLRVARALAALCFCSASIPVFLLARRVLRSDWAAVAAALLAITGPWLAISTALYTENLAYPLFAWTLLAMAWAIERGSWRGDLLVVFAVVVCTVTRVQLYALLPAWLVAVWFVAWGRSDGWRDFIRRAPRIAPISHAILGLVLLGVLFRYETGHLHADLQRLLGAYSELQDRGHLSSDTLLAVAHEVQALALPAFLAAVAGLAWYAGSLRAPRPSSRWSFAVLALCVTAVLWLISAYVQGGYIGDVTEERYFFYVFPLVWIGAFAALEEPAVAGPRLVAAGIPLIILFATLGQPRELDPQSTFLAPSAAVARNAFERLIAQFHLTGLSTRDAIAIVAIILLTVGVWVWRRRPGGRVLAFVAASIALQLAVTTYALAARTGHVPGIPSQVGGIIALNAWVDHKAGGNDITFLNNQAYGIDPSAEGWQYPTLLWNSRITTWANDSAAGVPDPVATVAALPVRQIEYDPQAGLVHGLEHAGPFVSYIASPFFQVAGTEIAEGPGNNLQLLKPVEPVQATWRSQRLQADGSVDAQKPAVFDAWVPPGPDAKRLRIVLQLLSPNGASKATFHFGNQTRAVELAANEKKLETFDVCTTGRHVAGSAQTDTSATWPDGRVTGPRITGVRVSTAPDGRC